MPDLSTKVVASVLPPTVMLAQTDGAAGTVNGADFFPICALSWLSVFLEVTRTDAGAGDSLAVTLEESMDGVTWFPWARFQNVLGTTAEPEFQLYQAHREYHSDAIISDAQLTAALGSGADKIGVAAGDHYSLPHLRAVGVIAGATAVFTYRVILFGAGA